MARLKQNVPEIRFEGFSGEWEEKVLREYVNSLDAGVSVNSEDLQSDVQYWILKTSCISGDAFNPEERKAVIAKDEIIRLKEPLLDDSILMSRMNTPNLVGLSGYINTAPKNTYLPDRLWQLKVNRDKADVKCLSYLLATEKSLNLRQSNATGTSGSMKNISKTSVLNEKIILPTLKEQTQIGIFFQQLDRLIELQTRAVEIAERHKKAMLQKLFPQKGEQVPRIRFAGFSGDWNSVYLYDVIDKVIDFRGRTPLKLGMSWDDSGEYLALSALNVKQGYIDYNVDAHFGNKDLYQIWMNGNELKKGQVLFTTEAPMGNVAQIPDNKGYILSQRTVAFVVNKQKLLDDFLVCLLRSFSVVKELQSLASGGTAKGVSQKSLSSLKINLPSSLEEQTAIGDFFQKLDEKITSEQRKLARYQMMKRAMLQRMFV